MTLHERLKADTRADHERMEAAFALDHWLSTPETYRALLLRLHGVHAAIERSAAPHLAGTGLVVEGRARLLLDDVAALDGRTADATRLPVSAEIGRIATCRASAAGAAYVAEGSSLGGLLIAREVRRRLGLTAETGNGFFGQDGKATAARWRAFTAALDRLGESIPDDVAVAAARATFAAMEAWLTAEPAAAGRDAA